MQRLSSAVQQAGFHPPTTSKDSPRVPRWTLSQLSYGLLHRHLLKASPALPQPPLVQGLIPPSRRKGPFVWETQASDGRCDLPYHRDFSQVEMGNAVSDKWPQRGCEKWRLPRSENEPSPATAATQVHRTVKIIYIETSVFTDIMTLSGSGGGLRRKRSKWGGDGCATSAWKGKENGARQQICGETRREEADFDWIRTENARTAVGERETTISSGTMEGRPRENCCADR